MDKSNGCIMGNFATHIPQRTIFEWLDGFDKILVTGPQRSGTRICAQMIAKDTGHTYVDERNINFESLYRLWSLCHKDERLVIQCPALCRHVHAFDADTVAVVLMRRNVEDIIASQERIGWNLEKVELARYDLSEGVIAKVKYQFWDDYQKERIKHAFEIEYESLANHPLWVTKELRWDFDATQTKP